MQRGGNRPGAGRPAGSQNADTATIRAALSGLLEGQVAVAIEALADIAQNGTSEAARVSAACAILDRTHGRPRQAVEMETVTSPEPMQVKLCIEEPLHLTWGNATTSALHEMHKLLVDADHPQAGAVAAEIGRRGHPSS